MWLPILLLNSILSSVEKWPKKQMDAAKIMQSPCKASIRPLIRSNFDFTLSP